MPMGGSSRGRLTAGFLLATCTPGFVCASLLALYEFKTMNLPAFLLGYVGFLGFSLCVTVPATVVFGIATYLMYERRGWKSWWSYGLGGALIGWGFIVLLTVLIPPSTWSLSIGFLWLGLLAAGFGAISALTLWLILYARARVLPMVFGLFCLGLLVIGLVRYLVA